ncbi:MAG: malate dehydrogenase [Gammaproteobacteria bacterium]|nr:malate dehydrogenase [Gammaproteobacteria bacterium]NIR59131.1 malate dehydrogenase [Gammaproteobacteria bacterium]
MRKISIYGAGRVGEAAAQLIAAQELCRHVVLIDVREGVAKGAALDIQESAPLFGFDTRVTGAQGGEAVAGSDFVIVTAGVPRKPGMSRSEVLDTNAEVIDGIAEDLLHHAPAAYVLVVTNPVDVLTYRMRERTGWEPRRVFGLSGVLDAARMAAFIALETGFSVRDVTAMVLGGHGDAMVPLPRFSTVGGVPVSQFLDEGTLERISDRTRQGGAEILSLKETSSAYDSPGASVAAMVDAVCRERRRLLPCVAYLDGEYDERDIYLGVPSIVGARGVEQVVELPLNETEAAAFCTSAGYVRADLKRLAS